MRFADPGKRRFTDSSRTASAERSTPPYVARDWSPRLFCPECFDGEFLGSGVGDVFARLNARRKFRARSSAFRVRSYPVISNLRQRVRRARFTLDVGKRRARAVRPSERHTRTHHTSTHPPPVSNKMAAVISSSVTARVVAGSAASASRARGAASLKAVSMGPKAARRGALVVSAVRSGARRTRGSRDARGEPRARVFRAGDARGDASGDAAPARASTSREPRAIARAAWSA